MKETLAIINQMQADGVIRKYAIGGAVGATFYLEPFATLYIDIFVRFKNSGLLVDLSPIYTYLTARGCTVKGEYIVIGEWPVQFLPSGNAMGDEALEQAIETEVEGVRTWVMTAEHLVAIALQTGRSKDFARIVQFVESGKLDPNRLDDVLQRHDLIAKWKHFEDKYLKE